MVNVLTPCRGWPSAPAPVTVALYLVPYFRADDGTQELPSTRSLPSTCLPSPVVRVTEETFPPPGRLTLISVLTGLFFAPSAGLTVRPSATGADGDAPSDCAGVTASVLGEAPVPPTNSASFFWSPPQPARASDAARTRAPAIAPPRVNLPIPTSVLAYLADIVPHADHRLDPGRPPSGGSEAFCPLSSPEEWSRVSDWNPAHGPCYVFSVADERR